MHTHSLKKNNKKTGSRETVYELQTTLVSPSSCMSSEVVAEIQSR